MGSSPEPGQRLESSPQKLALQFTEKLIPSLSKATLLGPDGQRIPVEQAADDRRLELTPQAALDRGAYRVEWQSVSPYDGHTLQGVFSFGVRAPAVATEQVIEQSPLARNGWVRVLARGALYAFGLTFAAALLLPLLLGGRAWPAPDAMREDADVAAVRARHDRITANLGWLAVAAAVVATLAEAVDAASGLDPAGMSTYLLSNTAGAARVMMVMLLLGPALFWHRRPRAGAALVVLALGAIAASGHASSASPRAASIVNDWIHLTAGAVWLGGIALLVAVWAPSLRRGGRRLRSAVARHVLTAFGRPALPAFVLVAGTGLISLVVQLGALEALWTTDYGRLLAVKIAIVAFIALASATHALRLRPRLLAANPHPRERDERRHWRLVLAEPTLAVGVVAAVALLVGFPLTPRQLDEATEAAAAAAPACDPCPLPKPAGDELAVGQNAGTHVVAAWVRRGPRAVTGTIRVIDRAGRAAKAPVTAPGLRTEPCGHGCLRFSAPAPTRELRVAVRERGRRYAVSLPTRWVTEDADRARRILERAQQTMRELDSVIESEKITSGPGTGAEVVYRLQAPDRMASRTSTGTRIVIVDDTQWLRTPDGSWQKGPYGAGLDFRMRRWFRFTPYARTIRLLGIARQDGRRVAELALFDEATPLWTRLRVDLKTHRILTVRMIAKANYITIRYSHFNEPLDITVPEQARARD